MAREVGHNFKGDESNCQSKILEHSSIETKHSALFFCQRSHFQKCVPALNRVYLVLEMAKETEIVPIEREQDFSL